MGLIKNMRVRLSCLQSIHEDREKNSATKKKLQHNKAVDSFEPPNGDASQMHKGKAFGRMESLAENPSRPRQLPKVDSRRIQEETLHSFIRVIMGGPLSTAKLEEAEKNLSKIHTGHWMCTEAVIWRCIAERIRGVHTRGKFKELLQEHPSNRIVLLNLCASNFAPGLRPGKNNEPFHDIALLREYLTNNPTDRYGLLLDALMTDQFENKPEIALEKLEKLYLNYPTYTPSLSCMAALLKQQGLYDGALSFAQEAFEKEPGNFQACVLATQLKVTAAPIDASKNDLPRVHEYYFPTNPYYVLFLPYSIQDEDVR